MEEARFLSARQIQLEYVPERTAAEMLARAFALLTDRELEKPVRRHSVQSSERGQVVHGRELQEVMR